MGTADRSAPLRRTGSLLALLGLELVAVLALHWLGRFPGLRIRWEEPVPWLLSSPVQEVLGAVLRMVGLVMAYWLLASTLLYLLASLTRLPAAVRAVSWATIPLVRRVADHAVAVTLATSMVGGGTFGVAGPAMAAPDRGGTGPPARKPVAAAQATSSTAAQDAPSTSAEPSYVPDPADQAPTTDAEKAAPTTDAEATSSTAGAATRPSRPAYVPNPADQAPKRLPATDPTSSTAAPTTPSTTAPSTAAPTTPSTAAPSTAAPTTPSTAAPSTAAPTTPSTAAPSTAAPQPPPSQAREGNAAGTTSTTGLRPPAYEFTPATTTTTNPKGERESAGPGEGERESGGPSEDEGGSGESGDGGRPGESGGGGGNPGGGGSTPDARQETSHPVVDGDNLWTIARNRLAQARSGRSGEPTNREVADYWVRVIEANQERLRSDDPDLIYPGEKIILPPVD